MAQFGLKNTLRPILDIKVGEKQGYMAEASTNMLEQCGYSEADQWNDQRENEVLCCTSQ